MAPEPGIYQAPSTARQQMQSTAHARLASRPQAPYLCTSSWPRGACLPHACLPGRDGTADFRTGMLRSRRPCCPRAFTAPTTGAPDRYSRPGADDATSTGGGGDHHVPDRTSAPSRSSPASPTAVGSAAPLAAAVLAVRLRPLLLVAPSPAAVPPFPPPSEMALATCTKAERRPAMARA